MEMQALEASPLCGRTGQEDAATLETGVPAEQG